MRKALRFLVLLFAVAHLSSCENIHRRNYFVEGEFSGLNVYNTNENTIYLSQKFLKKNMKLRRVLMLLMMFIKRNIMH